jgi:cyanophycinase-like exopeptidase
MHAPVYLAATGDAVLTLLAARAYAALRKERARVAVTYAPVEGDAGGLRFMSERMPRLFPDATLERIDRDPSVVDRADLVFVTGGDPTLGAKVLARSGAADWIRAASARGVPTLGVSAGAIILGAWWVDWPEQEDDDDGASGETSDDAAQLLPCISVLPGHVFDTHNEEDDWDELRVAARLAARAGTHARFLGIPSGGALVFRGDGAMEVVGKPPFELR